MTTTTTLTYEPCGQCGAPLDERQRYCVECGTSRRHPADPVARHFTQVARQANPEPAVLAPQPRRGADARVTALVLALLPAAAQPASVVIQTWSFGFAPQPIHLAAGRRMTLTLVNQSGASHDFKAVSFFGSSTILASPRCP